MDNSGGDAVARVLVENGVTEAYVLLGNQTVDVADGLDSRGRDVITARHEYNAAVMADTYGRLTGDPGIALTVAGPGATNALTGVAQAYTAASPMILVSAVLPKDAPTESLHGVDDPFFLEKAFEPATKWSTQVHDAERVPDALNRAFDVATRGRPGPVFVGIDEEILMESVDIPESAFEWTPVSDTPPSPSAATDALETVTNAEKRMLYVGKGVLRSFSSDQAVAIAEALECPVVCPRHYPDSFPNDHELFAGTVGMSDHPAAVGALAEAEAVLSIGVRPSSHEAAVLDDRTSDEVEIAYLHSGQSEFPQSSAAAVVGGDLATTLPAIADTLADEVSKTDGDYRDTVQAERRRVEDEIKSYLDSVAEQTPIHPLVIMDALRDVTDDDVILTGDAGAAGGAWPNDAFEYRTTNTFQHSRLYDSMGFPVPAGNVAKLVEPERQVVNLIGDGGMLMCNMELVTAAATETDAVTIVMNDAKYGMIWNYQQRDGHAEVATDIPQVDFATMAETMGVQGVRIEDPAAVRHALEEALDADEHVVLDIVTDPAADYVSRTVW
ncbi:acetolactate synthase, large subunit [Natrialba chahannaoensis JCM 10990]|uniref:Acetolactate synthase, large subunit n=1 Tax=Natrialba chahannaoensis JCM 10990 TaxID=1227492 RepID=M0B2D8_9EURY|nr:thiamine pyrophosphate-binding protein [Natrialba chahannaoensis]ELZ05051.1 acetolactate synthase, large subunit [Natrialba chahannaoensis JCM 10990]